MAAAKEVCSGVLAGVSSSASNGVTYGRRAVAPCYLVVVGIGYLLFNITEGYRKFQHSGTIIEAACAASCFIM